MAQEMEKHANELKSAVDELVLLLERYGCPVSKSESIAIGIICEQGYVLIKREEREPRNA